MAAKKLDSKILDELFAITEEEGSESNVGTGAKVIPMNQEAQAQSPGTATAIGAPKPSSRTFRISNKNLLILGALIILGVALYLHCNNKQEEEEKKD